MSKLAMQSAIKIQSTRLGHQFRQLAQPVEDESHTLNLRCKPRDASAAGKNF